jgi:hypothetical protein
MLEIFDRISLAKGKEHRRVKDMQPEDGPERAVEAQSVESPPAESMSPASNEAGAGDPVRSIERPAPRNREQRRRRPARAAIATRHHRAAAPMSRTCCTGTNRRGQGTGTARSQAQSRCGKPLCQSRDERHENRPFGNPEDQAPAPHQCVRLADRSQGRAENAQSRSPQGNA